MGNIFTPECAIKNYDENSFILGGMKGYNILNTDNIEIHGEAPPLVFTQISVNYKPIFTSNESDEFKYKDNKLILKYNSDFVAEFAAISFIEPQRNLYAYRLKGYDEQWNYVDASQRRANYTNLPKGDYVLQVKASNENGMWTKQPT